MTSVVLKQHALVKKSNVRSEKNDDNGDFDSCCHCCCCFCCDGCFEYPRCTCVEYFDRVDTLDEDIDTDEEDVVDEHNGGVSFVNGGDEFILLLMNGDLNSVI